MDPAWTGSRAFLRAATGGRSAAARDLYDEALVPAYDWEQVCREIVYAGEREFLEWLYVPAARCAGASSRGEWPAVGFTAYPVNLMLLGENIGQEAPDSPLKR